jgi:hypothetical protein
MLFPRLTAAALALLTASALAQDVPAAPKEPEIKIVPPSINKEAGLVSVPGVFWNELQAIWIEVAFCGRPSDFLHETIASACITKSSLLDALHIAGFRNESYWVDNPADFPRLRGDRLLVLLEVTLDGKTETFPLDEMISFRGWNVSVGPYGWMFKGSPPQAATTASQPFPVKPPGNQIVTDAMRILTDDPQIALQFRGLMHTSRSFIDYPLAYIDWVMPDFDYVRNMQIEPRTLALPKPDPKAPTIPRDTPAALHTRLLTQFWTTLYNSNGTIPVKISFQKVDEVTYLTEVAKVWHDADAAKFFLTQMEVARTIDNDKAEWLTLLPKVRAMAAAARIVDPEKPIAQSPEFLRMTILAATIEKNYATLDAAWATWSADHVHLDDDPTTHAEVISEAKVWKEHMQLRQQSAAQNLIVEQALVDAASISQKPDSPENRRALQKANGMEIEGRARAMLASNKQVLDFWTLRKETLDPTDPRTEMKRNILTQLALAQARVATGNAGIAYGQALQSADPAALAATQQTYKKAVLTMTIAGLQTQLADLEFEISKREGTDDPDLAAMLKQRDAINQQLKSAQSAATQP